MKVALYCRKVFLKTYRQFIYTSGMSNLQINLIQFHVFLPLLEKQKQFLIPIEEVIQDSPASFNMLEYQINNQVKFQEVALKYFKYYHKQEHSKFKIVNIPEIQWLNFYGKMT
ncbi:hypothetical protein ABPG74_022071 [Tetrahymena malaccensis]